MNSETNRILMLMAKEGSEYERRLSRLLSAADHENFEAIRGVQLGLWSKWARRAQEEY